MFTAVTFAAEQGLSICFPLLKMVIFELVTRTKHVRMTVFGNLINMEYVVSRGSLPFYQ